MKLMLQVTAAVSLWLVNAAIIYYIDPAVIRDVFIPNVYLPLVTMVWIASLYTISLFTAKKRVTFFVATLIALTLLFLLVWTR